MHQTHITIDDDIFSKVQSVSNTLNISIDDFIKKAINNELQHSFKNSDLFLSIKDLEDNNTIAIDDVDSYIKELRDATQ